MTLSILTLNLWHDAGPWEQRCERIQEWIARLDPDIIGFQEALQGESFDQVASLFEPGTYHLDFVHASSFWGERTASFGNAIASRWPILDREELRLPDRGDPETRAALSVTVDAPFGEVSFTCTHLHWRLHHGEVRERQVKELADFVLRRRPKNGFPPVVVGDFNADPESDEIRYMTGHHSIDGKRVFFHDAWRVVGSEGSGMTWSNRNPYAKESLEPDRRIDYIFTGYPQLGGQGLLERCEVVCNEASESVWPSDHFGLYAELRTEPVREG